MGRRLALIIGNSVYQDQTLARLKSPDVDVGALRDILKDSQRGNFDDVDLLFNSTSTNVRMAISGFFSGKSRDDLLVLYFSGHGVLDENGRLYLAVKDTKHNLLRATGIPSGFVAEEMDNSRSQCQVLVLDCCHSGAFARGAKGTPGSSVGTASAFGGTGSGRVVLTATDATQYAWEGDRIIGEAEGSFFTHFLVKGLQTGEADYNRDGQITVNELFDYVYDEVLKRSPNQTPSKWSSKEQGEIVIARAPGVEPDSQFSVSLQPSPIRAGQAARLTVKNQGNIQRTFSLTLHDRNKELDFDPPTAELRVFGGQSSTFEFRVQPRQKRIFGHKRSYPFTATVRSLQGESQTQPGEVVAGALLPPWIFSVPLMIVLCLCLSIVAGAGIWIYRYVQANADATGTAVAIASELAPSEGAGSHTKTVSPTITFTTTEDANAPSGSSVTTQDIPTPIPTESNTPTPTEANPPIPTESNTPTPTESHTPIPEEPTETSMPVKVDIPASRDAFVGEMLEYRDSIENINYGSRLVLSVDHTYYDSSIGTSVSKSFLYFDLTSIPSESEIVTATLRLFLEKSSIQPIPDPELISVFQAEDPWDESSITWKNQPSLYPSSAMQTAHIVNSTYYEWNVGPLVGKWVTGELQNNGLALVANTSAGYYGSRTFASREISDSDPSKVPILRITYQEP